MIDGGRRYRPAWAEVDLDAIAHNTRVMAGEVAPARLCAVVKADGYGHGAPAVARAALAGGATWLAVALVEEGAELRDAGIDAPVLLLSEPPAGAMEEVVARRLRPTLYTPPGVVAAAKAAASLVGAAGARLPVHVKVDTGMHRVGARPAVAYEVAMAVAESDELRLDGLWTHLAVADDPASPFTAEQLATFEALRRRLAGAGVAAATLHAANSAGVLGFPESRLDLARCG
ncbi:MAG: alanine racemase, partial [Acidimicrobiales bacterium]